MSNFLEYLNAKNKVADQPKVKMVADELEVPVKSPYPAKEKRGIKDGKQAQVKEVRSFAEYLDTKGKTVERPETEIVADYKDPEPYAPPKIGETMPSSYRAPGKDPGQQKGEDGFANQGPKEMVYKPKTGSDLEYVDDALASKTKKEWYSNTLAIKNLVESMSAYDVDNLVFEVKRQGGLTKLLDSLLNHPETYKEIASLLTNEETGVRRCRNFTNAFNSLGEGIAPPFGTNPDHLEKDDDTEDIEDDDHEPGDMNDMHDDSDDTPDSDIPGEKHDDALIGSDEMGDDDDSTFHKDMDDSHDDMPDDMDSDDSDDDGMDDMGDEDSDMDMGGDEDRPDMAPGGKHLHRHKEFMGAFDRMRKRMGMY